MKTNPLTIAGLGLACSQMASAADIPPAPPPPAPYYKPAAYAPIFNWTGFYLGLHAGGGWGKKSWSDPILFGDLGSHNVSGGLAGGQVGFNYQAGPAVFLEVGPGTALAPA